MFARLVSLIRFFFFFSTRFNRHSFVGGGELIITKKKRNVTSQNWKFDHRNEIRKSQQWRCLQLCYYTFLSLSGTRYNQQLQRNLAIFGYDLSSRSPQLPQPMSISWCWCRPNIRRMYNVDIQTAQANAWRKRAKFLYKMKACCNKECRYTDENIRYQATITQRLLNPAVLHSCSLCMLYRQWEAVVSP